MSFLDNLENNLKALENREERDPRAAERRAAQEDAARQIAPWANKLRDSAYVQKLLGLAARAGIQRRTKIMPAWLDNSLRLTMREDKLELRPTPGGVAGVFLRGQDEVGQSTVDLDADPAELLARWLKSVDETPAGGL